MTGPTAAPEATALDTCGCCEPTPTADPVGNRAGLPALHYRVGTYATFLRRMLARLPSQEVPAGEHAGTHPLRALTTRTNDDPTIALLDAWAVTADVLTFYQERIANEGFLGTATERRSVLELARAIGYELGPGVSATTYIAFTVEEPPPVPRAGPGVPTLQTLQGNPGSMAPKSALVPAGTKVQSVPGPGEKPQTFETSAELTARPEWNVLRPRLTQPQPLDPTASTAWVEGIVTDLKAGGRLLFLSGTTGAITATAKAVAAVTPEDALNRTRLDLANPPATPGFTPPQKSLLSFTLPSLVAVALKATSVKGLVLEKTWREKDLSAFIGVQRWNARALARHVGTLRLQRAVPPAATFALEPVEPGLVAFTVRAAAFGHNAPKWASLPLSQRSTTSPGGDPYAPYPSSWDTTPRSIAEDSQGNPYRPGGSANPHFFFERVVSEVQPGSWVLLEGGGVPKPLRVAQVSEASLADFALSSRATGVVVQNLDDSAVGETDLDGFKVRSTVLHGGSRPLALAQLPIAEDVGAGTAEASQVTLDTLLLGLTSGQAVAITGERADLPGVVVSEVVRVAEAVHAEGFTTLFFQAALQNRYARATVSLNANVVEATHGESVTEVLGGGNGAIANQRFEPKKPPLTYVPSNDPSGRASTLVVRVNDLQWNEVPSLFGQAPDARVYTVRLADDSKISVVFGDGRQGARLPTASDNAVATYRTGLGLAGEVDAGALTILQSRPLGIREASNPVPATGAEGPETLSDARANAPLTVRTLERIVSLRDYADFARAFAGVGKADAGALWDGRRRVVAITVASASGKPVDETSKLYSSLVAAIAAASTGMEPVRVCSFQPAYFNLEARIEVAEEYQAASVLAAAEAAVLQAFGFARRGFGQAVTAAEVVAVLHRVEGLVAVDLDALYRVDATGAGDKAPAARLPAASARWQDEDVALAELLLVNPAGVDLRELA